MTIKLIKKCSQCGEKMKEMKEITICYNCWLKEKAKNEIKKGQCLL